MLIKKAKRFFLICLLSFALCSIFTAKTFGQQGEITLFVDNSVGMSGDGLSWPEAFKTLQEALDLAKFPNTGHWEIRVAQGTYAPLGIITPFIIGTKSGEFGVDRIELLGGYAGLQAPSGVSPDARDPKAYPTILSGDIGGVNGVPGQEDNPFPGGKEVYSDSTRTDNAVNVLLVIGAGPGNRIEGFTIEGGFGGAVLFPESKINIGAGMIVLNSAIDIVNCTFRYNTTGIPFEEPEGQGTDPGKTSDGGGATVRGGQVVMGEVQYTRFINCTFHDNFAARGGGLALVDGSLEDPNVKLINCRFYDNRVIELSTAVIKPDEGNDRLVRLPVEGQSP